MNRSFKVVSVLSAPLFTPASMSSIFKAFADFNVMSLSNLSVVILTTDAFILPPDVMSILPSFANTFVTFKSSASLIIMSPFKLETALTLVTNVFNEISNVAATSKFVPINTELASVLTSFALISIFFIAATIPP